MTTSPTSPTSLPDMDAARTLHTAQCAVKHRSDSATAKCVAKYALQLAISPTSDQPADDTANVPMGTSDTDTTSTDTDGTSTDDTSDQPATKCRKGSPKGHTWQWFTKNAADVITAWSCSACGRKTTSDPTVTDDQPDQPATKPAAWAPETDDQPVTTITITDMVNRATARRDGYVNGAKELASDIFRAYVSGAWSKVMRDKNGESVRRYPTWESFVNALRVKSAFNVRDNGVRNVRNALVVAMYHADNERLPDQSDLYFAAGMTRSGFAKLATRLELNWYDKTTSPASDGNAVSDADDQPATVPATPVMVEGIPAKYVDMLREMSVAGLLKVIGTDAAVELSAHLETLASDQPAEDQPAEDQPAEDQPAEDQPAEDQPAEDQPATAVTSAGRRAQRHIRRRGGKTNGTPVRAGLSDADMAAMFASASV